jgi:hypothetical protein
MKGCANPNDRHPARNYHHLKIWFGGYDFRSWRGLRYMVGALSFLLFSKIGPLPTLGTPGVKADLGHSLGRGCSSPASAPMSYREAYPAIEHAPRSRSTTIDNNIKPAHEWTWF